MSRLPSRLHHTAYVTKDLEATRAFYEDVIGLPLSATWSETDHLFGKDRTYCHVFFDLADGSSLAKWKEQRRQLIVGRTAIVVNVRDLKATVDGDKATAQFRQYYASGALKTTTRKTLRMQREKGQWRITHEGTGS